MKPLALALCIAASGAMAPTVAAQEKATAAGEKATTEAAPQPSKTQDLIEASRAAKGKRKKSTSKVITNADVKKSKGKLVETTLPPIPFEAPPPGTMVERHEAAKKASAEAEVRLAEAEKDVAELEKELAAIEQRYYEENDLQRRDGEIVARFNDVRRRLDAARKELQSLTPQPTAAEPES